MFIVNFEPLARASIAHHLLLYKCDEPVVAETNVWECAVICKKPRYASVLYAWGKNAPPVQLPKDVGFEIDSGYFVLQIHYLHAIPDTQPSDHSGVRITITPQRQKYKAGIFLLYSNSQLIPAHAPKVHADVSCPYTGADIHPFAFRVHAHTLGRVISGYVSHNNTWQLIGKGNPAWPQAFYPVEKNITVKNDDVLVARCTFDATNRDIDTNMGATHTDEMCNFYMMYYTDVDHGQAFGMCGINQYPYLFRELPPGNDVPLPPNPLLESKAAGHMEQGNDDAAITEVEGWMKMQPTDNLVLGQISGIATDSKGNLHVFHRADRVWGSLTFDADDRYNDIKGGPIKANTLAVFGEAGQVIKQWGGNMFYMPHGLHVDKDDNVWLTDVAMHQVFRISLDKSRSDLILGEKLVPGTDDAHFCKPTDIAVLSTGEFFVTDGYCNARVMKFSKDGKLLHKWGSHSNSVTASGFPPPSTFDLPHSLTTLEDKGLVCVADRQNGRIQCFDLDGKFIHEMHPGGFAGNVYGVQYRQANGLLFAVNGPDSYEDSILQLGFALDPSSGMLLETFRPHSVNFTKLHSVAVSPSGDAVYVSETGPNKLWKFAVAEDRFLAHKSVKKADVDNNVEKTKSKITPVKKAGTSIGLVHPVAVDNDLDNKVEKQIEKETGEDFDFGASMVIAALLVIPVLVMVAITIVMRLRKRGRMSYLEARGDATNRRFNIGKFFNRHKGFDRLNTEDSDHELEHLESDSEVDEFTATGTQRA
ncbi:hypothetical protein NP493_977g01004 [Ridgeia piscesae]|uniref:Peptidylglycine alpha-amidating monooxygenase n=1 Tax=Ridgeia piscesae TaxID=27915 RepID=A0AAD9KKC9_RIDPI|nr:hypothetical protein NP493_977g01004 [Ridgeia piscesae]